MGPIHEWWFKAMVDLKMDLFIVTVFEINCKWIEELEFITYLAKLVDSLRKSFQNATQPFKYDTYRTILNLNYEIAFYFILK